MLDVRDLECLTVLAEELHFNRAAIRLRMAQPALSKRVQKIETDLGIELFIRNPGGVTLSYAGAELMTHARRMLEEWRTLKQAADDLRAGSRGLVRIGAVGSAFYEALPTLLKPVRERLPDIELRVDEMETPELVHALQIGEVQIGFLRPPVNYGLEVHTVWVEHLVAAVPETSPLAALDRVTIRELAGQPFVFFQRSAGTGYWDRVAALFHQADLEFVPQETAQHVSTVLGQVALGSGVSIVPASSRRVAIPGVLYIALDVPTLLPLAVAINPKVIPLSARLALREMPAQPIGPGFVR